ncbi:NUMOD4 motif-containing HNH endonuclease [Bacillus nitratireducens]|uniref:NUMOD4 motif-containing HNH endonuclease n=1 Tax=Bacillus nitratireducens TaxID=2026193 RepID=UPI00089D1970|nr:NUMOD4 motif-containing HNH endonuclease [Bacillus nitratireducens]SEA91533.1 NUMOD4 motif-containing protein [Bacillus nitratireducens]
MEKWSKFEKSEKKMFYVSTVGRIKSVDKATRKERILKPTKRTDGYYAITVNKSDGGKKTCKTYKVHRLVGLAFIPNSENKPTINHLDGNKENNAIENLEWATREEQEAHARETGLKTSGNTPAIVLDSNGEVIARHSTTTEAFASYEGRQIYYSNDVQIFGNVIVMKQAYYDTLDENELFVIVTNCFKHMLERAYVVDGQLVDTRDEASQKVGCTPQNVSQVTENKWSADINGHNVSRVSVMLNGSVDKNVGGNPNEKH